MRDLNLYSSGRLQTLPEDFRLFRKTFPQWGNSSGRLATLPEDLPRKSVTREVRLSGTTVCSTVLLYSYGCY